MFARNRTKTGRENRENPLGKTELQDENARRKLLAHNQKYRSLRRKASCLVYNGTQE
jgi:hypothetical protein